MLDESSLLKQFQSADPASALTVLFEKYADPIYRLALSIVRDPQQAEDVVQETFLSALTHREQFEGRSRLSTWLYRIAYNAGHERLRKRIDVPLPEEDSGDDVDFPLVMPKAFIEWQWTPEEILANTEMREELQRAVEKLPEPLRVVFLLRDIEGLTTEEASETLGLTPGATKVRLHRARLALREHLSSYFQERAIGDDL